jgi:hypothetical protein
MSRAIALTLRRELALLKASAFGLRAQLLMSHQLCNEIVRGLEFFDALPGPRVCIVVVVHDARAEYINEGEALTPTHTSPKRACAIVHSLCPVKRAY